MGQNFLKIPKNGGQISKITNLPLIVALIIDRFTCTDILAQECGIVMHTDILNYHCCPYIGQYLYKMGQNLLKIPKNRGSILKIVKFEAILTSKWVELHSMVS